jgi:queuine tRNA-ribosyltransferase
MSAFHFHVNACENRARAGTFHTPHGTVETPLFMPVGTLGTVKGLTPEQLQSCGAGIILANTYHLMLRPGAELIADLGGLHHFCGWQGPMLTDSGGFQVFSLAQRRKISEEGVTFQSHIDGSRHMLSPETSMKVQHHLGADIVMAFDECPPGTATREEVMAATDRTHRWATRSVKAFLKHQEERVHKSLPPQALFGIVQGGLHEDLRRASLTTLNQLPFQGLAMGGLSVGEAKADMYRILDRITHEFPEDKPRYLMGVGTPPDLVNGMAAGIDLFDCVMPTRNARNGQAFTSRGTVTIKQARHQRCQQPLDDACTCYTCRHFSRAYLHHLFRCREILSSVLLTLHNIHFYLKIAEDARQAIKHHTFSAFQHQICQAYQAPHLEFYREESS